MGKYLPSAGWNSIQAGGIHDNGFVDFIIFGNGPTFQLSVCEITGLTVRFQVQKVNSGLRSVVLSPKHERSPWLFFSLYLLHVTGLIYMVYWTNVSHTHWYVPQIIANKITGSWYLHKYKEVNKYILYTPFWETAFGDVDWIHLAQDRDRWRALVNTVMNLRVP
jgi:hypothetical protein